VLTIGAPARRLGPQTEAPTHFDWVGASLYPVVGIEEPTTSIYLRPYPLTPIGATRTMCFLR